MSHQEQPGLEIGSRVRVSRGYHWARMAVGTVAPFPSEVEQIGDSVASGAGRLISARDGYLLTYWIKFDEPQRDENGEGPYSEAAIEAGNLERLG